MTHAGPPPQGIPPEAVARFTAAEARLYPMALVDPAGYERAVALTGDLLAELRRTCPDVDTVLRRRSDLVRLLAEGSRERRGELAGLPPETLVDAASAVRCRELREEQRAAEAVARVAAARAARQEWLVDEPGPEAVMAGQYRRVELHVPTGTALVCSVEAGGGGSGVAYRLEVIAPLAADGTAGPGVTETFEDEASWSLALEWRRQELSSRP